MLRSVDQLIGYRLNTTDDELGKCQDLLFDDRWWTVRHLLANTGSWMTGRMVLVSPMMILKPDWASRKIYLTVDKKTVENCPAPLEDEPVSREHERKMALYYGYPNYWLGDGLWGPIPTPAVAEFMAAQAKEGEKDDGEPEPQTETNHLRSFREVKGYQIKAMDGDIGHVDDFILDDETWALRHVVVDTRNWLPGGKKVLLSLTWADSVNWSQRRFNMALTRDQIEKSPEFDPEKPVNAEVETRLYDFYGRPVEHQISKRIQQQIANPFV